MKFFRVLSILIAFYTLTAFAGPKDSELTPEGRKWVAFVRNVLRKPKDFDLFDQEYEVLARRSLLALVAQPDSQEAKRDLADAFHGFGHFAEYTLEFDKAIKMHTESLMLYEQVSLSTRESFHGAIHAREHILQSMVGAGKYWEQRRDYVKAENYFQKAYDFFNSARMWQYIAPNIFRLPGIEGDLQLVRTEADYREIIERINSKTKNFKEYYFSCKTVMKPY